ncbi:hypothetical protein [Pedobacter sp. UYP1]|uniref:hypothetical protein n=1 Tax=Pedobacter sp. UYP1 TaxID=1756396 RepID=UPI003395FD75
MFHAIVVKKAAALSSDQAILDLIGYKHLIADKRMPLIGITGVTSSLLITVLNYHEPLAIYSGTALIAILSHLGIYLKVAKPINEQLSSAAVSIVIPATIRLLQLRWDSIIVYRAIILAVAILALIIGSFVGS